MDFFEKIGKTISDLRIGKGLSQTELAEALGVTAATLKRWEAGKVQHIKIGYLIRIANYFNVTLDSILME